LSEAELDFTAPNVTIDPETALALQTQLRFRTTGTKVQPPRTVLHKEDWPPNYGDIMLWREAQLARYEAEPEFLADAKAFYATFDGCIHFINHWCSVYEPRNAGTDRPTWMPFILYKRQDEFVQFVLECLKAEQPGLVEKCRTMGATWLGVAVSVWAWLFIPGISIGWGSQDADAVSVIGDPSSIFEKIRMMIRRIPECFLPEGLTKDHLKHMECINPATGATIIGQVGDNIGRGGRTRIFFKDESAHYGHPELIEAALGETTRVPIDISSVNGLGNLFHRKREMGQDWYPGCKIERGFTRVFVMDSHDHPEYGDEWHKEKRAFHERQATLHIYAQEIERNYAASVQGTIIPKEWLDVCTDAHIKLNIPVEGPKISGLDLGDSEDGDRNAQAARTGIVLTFAAEWTARDPGVTARRAMGHCIDNHIQNLQYDAAGGLGSNVKSEVNRLRDDEAMNVNLQVVPWNAGGKVLRAADRVVEEDKQSPRNKDFFTNLKAQAWWALRTRIYRTFLLISALSEGGELASDPNSNNITVRMKDGRIVQYDADDLFSIDSKLQLLHKIQKELCQATASKGAKLKLLVDKTPEGTKSPNIADSIVMAYWPMPAHTGDFADIGLGAKAYIGGVSI
jgi:phage terminase large subunit